MDELILKKTRMLPDMDREIFARVNQFHQVHGFRPLAILLGPREYLSLKMKIQTIQGMASQDDVLSIGNIPVWVKQSAGVDLVLPHQNAAQFLIGSVLPPRPEPPPDKTPA